MDVADSLQGLLVVALLVAGTCVPADAVSAPVGCGINPRLEIIPAEPVAGQPVTFVAAGDWTDSCVPRRLEVAQSGSHLTVHAIHDYASGTGCLTVITPWRLVQPVGAFVPGSYSVRLYVQYQGDPSEAGPCAKLDFSVQPVTNEWYLPLAMR